MRVYTPVDVVRHVRDLDGERIAVDAQLRFAFEDYGLAQWRGSESGPSAQIDLEAPSPDGAFAFDMDVLSRWHGRRVVVLGEVRDMRGFITTGGASGASIVAHRIEPHELWVANHGPTDAA